MTKKSVILWFLAGWALSVFVSPQTVVGIFKPRSS